MFKNKIVIKIHSYVLNYSSKWGEIGANMIFCVLDCGKCCERFSRKSQECSTSTNSCQRCCCFSVAQSCLTLCHPMDCSMPGSSLLHHLMEFAQIRVHWLGWCCPSLLSPSPLAFSLSQHEDLSQLFDSSYQVAKVLELQLQQWIFKVDFF